MKRIIKSTLALLLGANILTSPVYAAEKITYGKGPGAYTELFEAGVKPILEEKGYEFEAIDVSDVVQNNIGLVDGDIDFNVEQHNAFLGKFNEEHGSNLVSITAVPTLPAGIFSQEYKSINDIFEGARIALGNDATDPARAYTLLEKAGWIKLDENVDFSDLSQDAIVENPYNLEFIELDPAVIAQTLDEFDFAVIDGSTQYRAGIDGADALLQEDVRDELVLQAVVKEDVDSDWAKALFEAYKSEEFAKYIEENEAGKWFIPEELKK